MEPRTFNSLVQKIGRCVRNFLELGEAIIFITKSSFKACCAQFDVGEGEKSTPEEGGLSGANEVREPQLPDQSADYSEDEDEDEGDSEDADEGTGEGEGEDIDVDVVEPLHAAVEGDSAPSKRLRKPRRKVLTRIEARDRWFLQWFLTTEECRRIPWDVFFMNKHKGIL